MQRNKNTSEVTELNDNVFAADPDFPFSSSEFTFFKPGRGILIEFPVRPDVAAAQKAGHHPDHRAVV
ncbi:hypothetical protein [Brevirhabdus pacifica]|uniref:hypothetical protein n=1 Tax=Brevirhabdus pacifica TaxID=1267768 RepID=UPI00117EA95F|nr:hypothetical protein [Brevirhabdus pacifica]